MSDKILTTTVVVKVGLLPEKITALGIEFSPHNQVALLAILSSVVIYFLIAFIIYGLSDYIGWRLQIHEELKRLYSLREQQQETGVVAPTPLGSKEEAMSLRTYSNRVSLIRVAFDILFPIVVALFSVKLLLFR